MLVSHGRGGAGNIARSSKYDAVTPSDLRTPALTSAVVTTGRGGTGNMLRNDDAESTRLRQDCEAGPRRTSSGAAHFGRGGAANIFRQSLFHEEEDEAAAAAGKLSFESAAVDDEEGEENLAPATSNRRRSSELAARGKAWLQGLTGKKA